MTDFRQPRRTLQCPTADIWTKDCPSAFTASSDRRDLRLPLLVPARQEVGLRVLWMGQAFSCSVSKGQNTWWLPDCLHVLGLVSRVCFLEPRKRLAVSSEVSAGLRGQWGGRDEQVMI